MTEACFHYTALAADIGPERIAAGQLNTVADPVSGRKFPALAYSYIVDMDGAVFWAHDIDVQTWGNGASGANKRQVAICYCGDYEPNAAQITGLRSAREHAEGLLGRALAVVGHKTSFATQCPGPVMETWLPLV